jgi:hypothetical protein
MKCPKCGSEVHLFKLSDKIGIKNKYNEHRYPIRICNSCRYQEDKYVYERRIKREHAYQQRLDNVLKHFKKNDKTNYDDFQYYLYLGKTGITVDYDKGKFLLEDNDLHTVQISLDTVESLLKDLGAMKDV